MDDYRAASLQGWSAVAPDWAELTDRIDRQLGAAAEWMMEALALEPGERVLELAGGPGTLSLMAARAVGPDGHVIYSDFAEPMVTAARERLEREGVTNVECHVMDAEAIDIPDGSVDAVACRMGFMLMADPAAAMRESARVLASGGRVALAVWAEPDSNPWAVLAMRAVASELGTPPAAPDAPGLWSLADKARLRETLEQAGLTSVRIVALDGTNDFDSADQWMELNRRLAGPLRTLMANLDERQRTAIEDSMREAVRPYQQSDGSISIPQRMLAASGRR
ncbi:MAG TPA: methyltransferase domain-containing protein [Solirubrobacteraceae bacterium]|nr:methyltransferase domain-containing protein [Solirubrobacteraceae bacterium]